MNSSKNRHGRPVQFMRFLGIKHSICLALLMLFGVSAAAAQGRSAIQRSAEIAKMDEQIAALDEQLAAIDEQIAATDEQIAALDALLCIEGDMAGCARACAAGEKDSCTRVPSTSKATTDYGLPVDVGARKQSCRELEYEMGAMAQSILNPKAFDECRRLGVKFGKP